MATGTSIITALSSFFTAIGEFFGYRREKQALENTPEMQANAKSKTVEAIKDESDKIVAKGDLDQLRKDLSE